MECDVLYAKTKPVKPPQAGRMATTTPRPAIPNCRWQANRNLNLQGCDQGYVSVFSFFEVVPKHRKDPDSFPLRSSSYQEQMADLQATELPLQTDHISRVDTIPVLHKAPFDHSAYVSGSRKNWRLLGWMPLLPATS